MADDLSFLHVCTRFQRGGSEQRLHDIIAAVPGSHRVAVGRGSDVDLARHQLPHCTVECWNELTRDPDPWLDARLVARLQGRLRAYPVDLLFTHQSKAGLIGRFAGRRTDTPVIHSVSMASTGPGYGAVKGRFFQLAERLAATSGQGYAVVGQDLLKRIVAHGVPRDRCTVVRSGARLATGDRSRRMRRLGLPPELHDLIDRPWIVAAGSLEPRKQVDQLPDLFRRIRLRDSGNDAVLLIAGGGPLEDTLARRLAAMDLLGDVRMLGHIDWAPELIAASDLLVMMSRAEGLPQVLVQAAAADTPFACFQVDGPGELMTMGARGSIVRTGDIEALAAAAAEWLDHRNESTTPSIDLTSWSEPEIHKAYRRVVARVLDRQLVS